jgi:hypothetical protein
MNRKNVVYKMRTQQLTERLPRSLAFARNDGSFKGSLEKSFQCMHCHYHVSTEPLVSGVQNRNHCPYCLWSKHVDWREAGDRLAVCRAEMQPVGLALKASRKKYGSAANGELMLVHLCRECGKVSINRIAADDDPERILDVFERSLALSSSILPQVELGGITALQVTEIRLVEVQLFGKQAIEVG